MNTFSCLRSFLFINKAQLNTHTYIHAFDKMMHKIVRERENMMLGVISRFSLESGPFHVRSEKPELKILLKLRASVNTW